MNLPSPFDLACPNVSRRVFLALPAFGPKLILISEISNGPGDGLKTDLAKSVGNQTMNGGRRPGAGRPKGAIAKSTYAIIEALQSGGEMPIQYMLRVMRDKEAPSFRRDEMAKMAARYLHPQMASLSEDVFEEAVPESEAATVPQAAE
jgi:hypothetical protein